MQTYLIALQSKTRKKKKQVEFADTIRSEQKLMDAKDALNGVEKVSKEDSEAACTGYSAKGILSQIELSIKPELKPELLRLLKE